MKSLVAFCLVAVVAAAPPSGINNPTDKVQITHYENDNLGIGNYNYVWEQTDGQKAQQSGQLRNEGREDESLALSGSFSWVAPDGVTYTVTYTADEEGYKPKIHKGPELTPYEETGGISNRFSSNSNSIAAILG